MKLIHSSFKVERVAAADSWTFHRCHANVIIYFVAFFVFCISSRYMYMYVCASVKNRRRLLATTFRANVRVYRIRFCKIPVYSGFLDTMKSAQGSISR